ncbi:hypothetical protein PR202_gb08618 [Eleusine coracana subsp. coracana]|uniref:Secreted protein n=1 Tax=Eleusine coracana subsp. coracana TaxID=191504 RepID=A0AAV5ECP8_ELECO|nr:hypothetical protein PR202_gb08618 [Eleusine coracana subsp. coracana]
MRRGSRRWRLLLFLFFLREQRLLCGWASAIKHGLRGPHLLLLLNGRRLLLLRGIPARPAAEDRPSPALEYVVHLAVEEPGEAPLPARVVAHGPERGLPCRRCAALPLLDLLVIAGEVAPPLAALHGAPLHAVPPAVLRDRGPLGLQCRRLPARRGGRRHAPPPAAPATALHHALALDEDQNLLPRPPREPRRATGRGGRGRSSSRRRGGGGGRRRWTWAGSWGRVLLWRKLT